MGRRHDKFDLMSGNEKPDWNMALFFLQRLDERLNDRDESFDNGDYIKCYRTLRTIYANIHFFLKQDGHEKEEAKLDKLFSDAKTNFMNLSHKQQEIQAIVITRFEILLDDITIILYDLLFEYNLVFPKKNTKNPARALDSFS